MKKKLFVWDFHGTLERGNVYAVQELVNKTILKVGHGNSISLEDTVKLYGLSWIDYFKYVHPGGSLDVWQKMKDITKEIQEKEKTVEKYMEPMYFADAVLGAIQGKGYSNIVLSNSELRWIKYFVELVGLAEYFDDYIAIDAHDRSREESELKQAKATALKRYIGQHAFDQVVKIGDRESDIEAGKSVGATTYFFRNEFNAGKQITVQPDYEISDLREVLKEL
ncbi:MAG: HAD family hydrolase [Patescibacteria group bacterium]